MWLLSSLWIPNIFWQPLMFIILLPLLSWHIHLHLGEFERICFQVLHTWIYRLSINILCICIHIYIYMCVFYTAYVNIYIYIYVFSRSKYFTELKWPKRSFRCFGYSWGLQGHQAPSPGAASCGVQGSWAPHANIKCCWNMNPRIETPKIVPVL